MQYEKTISFISNREHYTLSLGSILYVTMKKQDAYVHISDGRRKGSVDVSEKDDRLKQQAAQKCFAYILTYV